MSDGETYEAPSYQNCDGLSPSCPVEATIYSYRPNLGGAIFFAAVFFLCFTANFILAFRMKNYGFSAWLLIGIALEVVGYGARIALWNDPWEYGAMTAHLTGTVLAPSLVNVAISVTFKHIALYCGESNLKLRAKYYPVVFIGSDFTAIFIQCAGAGMSAAGTSGDGNRTLTDIASAVLVAGVSFQVVNMVFCGGLILLFAWNYKKAKRNTTTLEKAPCVYEQEKAEDPKAGRNSGCFIPEMAQGWRGELMQTESTFLILDGAMMALACILLTVFHPSIFFRFMAKGQRKPNSGDS